MNNPALTADSDTGSGSKLSRDGHNVQFSAGQAIIWQIKFIVNCYLNKKTLAQASAELQLVSPYLNSYLLAFRQIRL